MTAGAAPDIAPGTANPLGVTCDADGINIAVFSAHAEAVELCLFSDDGAAETGRIRLPGRTGDVHHGHVAGVGPGQMYGLRAHGPDAPEDGHRFNPAKLLIDPYARALSGPATWSPDLAGTNDADSAHAAPKCVVAEELPRIDPAERPHVPWTETVIYEAHAKGLTRLWPGLGAERTGYFEALGAPQVIDHLSALGITTLELLPIHAFADERRLAERGLSNYWGYNSIAFFAAEPRYLGAGGIAGFRETVRRLHDAGIEVILDVVYNHTGESDADGPTLSFRGLDNLSYYAREADAPGGYANHTGCGNTLDLSHPFVLRLVLESMRWWAERIGVDGFRFDLAPVLTRGPDGFDPGSRFLDALLADPVLKDLKLIAEPWDVGPDGYRPGQFPHPFAEWNDRFRDTVRAFWRGDAHAANELADGLLGSARIYDHEDRRPWASVNFVACHDGFSLADLTMYENKHNAANGEDNRDGHNGNLSDNFGTEGPTDDPDVTAARKRRRRNLLATALLAQGTPMLRAGDETGQSQGGNNNAYCQDNETSWIDWSDADGDLLRFTRRVLAVRRAVPLLRQGHFLHGAARGCDGRADVEWLGPDGGPVDWDDPALAGYALLIRGAAADTGTGNGAVLLALNRGDVAFAPGLDALPEDGWRCLLDTAQADGAPAGDGTTEVAPHSLAVFATLPLPGPDGVS